MPKRAERTGSAFVPINDGETKSNPFGAPIFKKGCQAEIGHSLNGTVYFFDREGPLVRRFSLPGWLREWLGEKTANDWEDVIARFRQGLNDFFQSEILIGSIFFAAVLFPLVLLIFGTLESRSWLGALLVLILLPYLTLRELPNAWRLLKVGYELFKGYIKSFFDDNFLGAGPIDLPLARIVDDIVVVNEGSFTLDWTLYGSGGLKTESGGSYAPSPRAFFSVRNPHYKVTTLVSIVET